MTTEEIIACVWKAFCSNRQKNCQRNSREVGIPVGSCHSVLINNLHMHYMPINTGLHKSLVSRTEKVQMSVLGDQIAVTDTDKNFLNYIVTGNKTGCFFFWYHPQTKRQLSEWKSTSFSQMKKRCVDRSKGKVMLEFPHPRVLFTRNLFQKAGQITGKYMLISFIV